MRPMRAARTWHGVTFLVAAAALVLQTALVVAGGAVLDETAVPPLGTRLLRLVSYFTIQSNLLVASTAYLLMRDPTRDGPLLRVVRLDAVAGITVTGVVHFFLLRPLLDLHGADALADALLHVVVPLLAVIGWLMHGPRPRIDLRTAALALVWPAAWLVYTLAMGAATGFYPYPFVDVSALGYGRVLLNGLGIAAMLVALFGLAALVDRRLSPRPTAES